jgi:nucleoside transporter
MNKAIRFKLFLMMVLELLIWGAWLPLINGYMQFLEFNDWQRTWVNNAFALASITAMFFSNQFADRNFAAEKFMAVSHLIGGLAILAMFWVKDFWPFFGLMLLHSLFYVPTISIANSIAFTHIKDAQREFGIVRMGGTVGWIAAAWPLFFLLGNKQGVAAQEAKAWIFILAGIASFVLAAFSLTLPHTPPKRAVEGVQKLAWLEAFSMLKQPFILVLFIVTFVDATIHMGYFIMTGGFLENGVKLEPKWIMPAMSIGQIAEIGTMAILGYVLKRFGWKKTMIFGILGHAARFAVYAFFPQYPGLIVLVQILHGICYAFFFATVYIFVDEFFPKDARSSAQGLFNFLILGAGPFVAGIIWPQLEGMFKTGDVVDYQKLFLIPTGMAVIAAFFLLAAFNPPGKAEAKVEGAPAPAH